MEPTRGVENRFRYWSTPMLKGRLFAVVEEMGVRPMTRSLRLGQLVEWVMKELPSIAPDDDRTQEALAIASVLWDHSRDVGRL